MKKVLLLGDSIRLSYQSKVRELLTGRAEVNGPEENCRFAKYTLWNVNIYMKLFGKPDIIHWNNGIWDTYKISDSIECFTTLEDYIRDMKLILNEMRKSGATILFANTTPVRPGFHLDNNDRIDMYNQAITEVMIKENVPVNDLNGVIKKNIDRYIGEDLLHLSSEGVEAAALKVADFIAEYL